jgi:hypothetical protein
MDPTDSRIGQLRRCRCAPSPGSSYARRRAGGAGPPQHRLVHECAAGRPQDRYRGHEGPRGERPDQLGIPGEPPRHGRQSRARRLVHLPARATRRGRRGRDRGRWSPGRSRDRPPAKRAVDAPIDLDAPTFATVLAIAEDAQSRIGPRYGPRASASAVRSRSLPELASASRSSLEARGGGVPVLVASSSADRACLRARRALKASHVSSSP